MRTPIALLAGTLLVACASGTRVVYVPAPASTPAPAPAPAPPARIIPMPMPPVGVNIVRVDDSRLLVSTNQPAYLAVFEIVPNRGVTLVYPTSPRLRQVPLAGSSWLNVSWRSARGIYDDDRPIRGRRVQAPMHHVYVVASERPLRLTENAFDDASLGAMLGSRAAMAEDPYETMAALSRRFVPPGRDEGWGEDVYAMDMVRPTVNVRVARIYCPDGSVVYSRDEMIDWFVCPWRDQGRTAQAPRPDSVVASSGRRVPRPVEPGPARIFRVPPPDTRPTNGNDVATRPAQGGWNGNGGRGGNDDADRGRDKPKDNNGNHYGWGRNGNAGNGSTATGNSGNGNTANPATGGTGTGNASGGNATGGNGASGGVTTANTGGNVASGGNDNAGDGKDKGNNGNHYGQIKNGNNGNNGSNANGNNTNGNAANGNTANAGAGGNGANAGDNGNNGNHYGQQRNGNNGNGNASGQTDAGVQQQGNAGPKPVAPPVVKEEPKPKQEAKGMRGVMDKMRDRTQPDSADAKDKKGKPDHE